MLFYTLVLLIIAVHLGSCDSVTNGPIAKGNSANPLSIYENDTAGRVPGDPTKAVEALKRIYQILNIYRVRHGGALPTDNRFITEDLVQNPTAYHFSSAQEALFFDVNPDARYADNQVARSMPDRVGVYHIVLQRPDRNPISGPKFSGTRDVLAFTDIYCHKNFKVTPEGRTTLNPVGFYLVLWDDGQVEKIPYDQVLFVPRGKHQNTYAFPRQAGIPWNCLAYDEFYSQTQDLFSTVPRGKPVPKGESLPYADDGGPEALISLSRLLGNSIDRQSLWDIFAPEKSTFSLEDIQQGAQKLKLPLKQQNATLEQIRHWSLPVLIQIAQPSRLVTLATVGQRNSIIYDGGALLIVDNDTLARRYTGNALLFGSASADSPIMVEDPVREVLVPSTSEAVTQTVALKNRSQRPIKIMLDRTFCGIAQAQLSPEILAPGQLATLRLSLRWRPGLRGSVQIATVVIHTDAIAQPQIQVGFKLRLSQTNA